MTAVVPSPADIAAALKHRHTWPDVLDEDDLRKIATFVAEKYPLVFAAAFAALLSEVTPR